MRFSATKDATSEQQSHCGGANGSNESLHRNYSVMVKFFDRQEMSNPLNGAEIITGVALSRIIDSSRNRNPFFCELIFENGCKLLVGIGPNVGCAQFTSSNAEPPYLMATQEIVECDTDDTVDFADTVDFLVGNTLTPVPRYYCMSMDSVKQIALHFLETGHRDPNFAWKGIKAKSDTNFSLK
jgi:hypothetical protein